MSLALTLEPFGIKLLELPAQFEFAIGSPGTLVDPPTFCLVRPAKRFRIRRLNHISKNSRFEVFRSVKIVENALSCSDCTRAKLERSLSHEVGGALKLIAMY